MKITNSGRGIHQREIPGLEKLKSLPNHWHAFTNLDLALPGRGVREIDLVMVIEDRILLVDLKDWKGPVTSKDGNWFNGKHDNGRSPIHKISENVRELSPLLKKFLTESIRRETGAAQKVGYPWIEGVVVLTRAHDRSGISGSEVSRVFSIDLFMKMLKNQSERDAQLGISPSKFIDFTSTEWIQRFRQFFNVTSGIFQVGTRRYGGFRSKTESPTFTHRDGIFSEFDVDEEGVEMSSGLLRRWDFTKAETRYQNEDGRSSIVGREKTVIAWLDDRNPDCGATLLKPKVDDQDRGVAYWEVFERRRRMKRLSGFSTTELHKMTSGERVELARQVLASAKTMHDLQAAHLDFGSHSVWLELPTTVKFSHLMAASFPEIESLGNARYQFLSSTSVPEDVLGSTCVPLRKDVFLLGCVVHTLLFGAPPSGDPPDWDATVDSEDSFSLLYPWFERCLDIDLMKRFGDASEMLSSFNAALSSVPNTKAIIEGLERFRTLKSQRQVFQAYSESELLKEDDRVAIWRSENQGEQRVIKLWKSNAIGDLGKEASRILAFLDRAEALIESPIPGVAALRAAHWTGDSIVLVQDFIQGPTLAEEITSRSLLSNSLLTVQFFLDLVEAVNVLHDRSLAHGDLKPGNIIVESPASDKLFPVMIDVIDFSPIQDGERISRAYAPSSGGRFERDRFAVTKIVEEVLGAEQLNEGIWTDIKLAIDTCRSGPPANATLLPLKEALERALLPAGSDESSVVSKVYLFGAQSGPMYSDEGFYWIARFGSQIFVRGAIEQLELKIDSSGKPIKGRRTKLSQVAIQRIKNHEFASFPGQIIIESSTTNLAAIAEILERPEITEAWASHIEIPKPDDRDDTDPDILSTEAQEDELAEKLITGPLEVKSVDIRQLWRRMVDAEAEFIAEAACLGDSTFRRNTKRHFAPIQMMVGELDFSIDDTVTVERQDAKGNWVRIGLLDIPASSPEYVVIESWFGLDRQPLVSDGNRLRFQSRYENTSRERREAATSRILKGAAAAPTLFDVFQPNANCVPRRVLCEINDNEVSERYGLNSVQVEAFKNILQCRPVGLLQGPPGTGKTRFIGALVHYALTHGLARNVLLASQSHEAVNNAGEAAIKLFGDDRDALSVIRVGQEGSVSETLRPYHVAYVEKAYKDKFLATSKMRLEVVARAIGLDQTQTDRVLYFEDAIRPVLARINELAQDNEPDLPRLNSLLTTVEQLLNTQGFKVELSDLDASVVEDEIASQYMSSIVGTEPANIDKLRQVAQLSRDIVGSVSTWQRSFETFLAGTRQVVAGTCVGLGRTSLGLTKTVFDLVIIDEAARCTSSELAVPIQAGKWVVLVGDHAQLEPTHPAAVVQSVADELCIPLHEVKRSDFERVFESLYGKTAGSTLTKQYRMLPPIGRLVSGAFYDRSLTHGRDQSSVNKGVMPLGLSKPLTWVSTDSFGAEAYQRPDKLRRGSLVNSVEAEVIVTMLKNWSTHEPFLTWLTSQPQQMQAIGIICAYAAQRDLVWKRIQTENLPDVVRRSLKVDTIDSYQGKENLIILLSLVRNNHDGRPNAKGKTITPGFMARKNRVNVAFSRAMDRLVIIGAFSRWLEGTPLGDVVEGFSEEIKSGEAALEDAKVILESSPARTKKEVVGRNDKKGAICQ